MTAPYKRVYIPDAVGQNRDRVRKLENADTLATPITLSSLDPISLQEEIYDDDGSVPNSYEIGRAHV